MAIGRVGSPEYRFIHILDFGLAREFVVHCDGKLRMRRPRQRALFSKTEPVHDSEMLSDKREVYEIKRRTEIDVVLENCPVQLIKFAEHLR
ncbi:hypothetical protein TELCIR_04185 [Teladorsagia circumcincta]|uniref:Protein kinase domain-containing protein n=1 Tax=Teladorsagia circumcincta TaxID=45464 RepID=A0A2G9UUB1_TELCI|nr:hypothetical protein TELCIR_04185 [Teladorsagia circumcincta]